MSHMSYMSHTSHAKNGTKMAKLDIAPTKSNFLEVRRSLEHAEEGYDLLEQKRQLLVIELMDRLEAAKTVQGEVDAKMAEAYDTLRKSALRMGSEELQHEALGVLLEHKVKLGTQSLMGLRLPQLQIEHEKPGLEFGVSATSAAADDVLQKFNEVLEVVGRFAELQTVVIRLSRELKSTQRRVNALEKRFLPDYRDTLKYIESVLEEHERDSFTVNKILKRRKARGR